MKQIDNWLARPIEEVQTPCSYCGGRGQVWEIVDNTKINEDVYLSSLIGVSGVVRLSQAIRARIEKGLK